ncbi:hypothetical protein AJ79_08790 [Helicocarpus griseus UAMH5409]|uniref:Endoplasmic reticulum junction formation protein lunapark n=1 Tax=Helicocarpus griseus UAMH5409 TaxID=1447875 RepID=A0A2B7WPY0_9EURO|nr:hypothetical protein AJ79_08790 [Helicocarpus griseus UAMH5409]
MVSLWPWKGSDTSPAGFEKTLSTLSGKIARATARLDTHRQRARRYKVLWTLYTSFAYLLCSIILTLVLGWQHWGPIEYTAVAGGPVVIYVVRLALDTYYQYRISNTQSYLDDLQKQRDKTIEKLKEATKYNSTQQLLEKYGGDSPQRSGQQKGPASGTGPGGAANKKRDPRMRVSLPAPSGRTGIAPPPTANIPRLQPGSVPTTPMRSPPMHDQRGPPQPSNLNPNQYQQEPSQQPPQLADEPGFAPNAFPPSYNQPPPAQQQHFDPHQSHWYDRILDVLLGEDETLPKNRLALICTQCRLVNGQAAPGIRNLEELGRWRCGSCGAWNGQESETKKALAGIQEAAAQSDIGGRGASPAVHSRNRSQSQPPVILEPSRGTEGAWEPVSGRASVSSEMGSGNLSTGDGTDASVVVGPTSSEGEGEEYGDDEVGEQSGAEDYGAVEVPAEEDGGDKKGLRKRSSGRGKKAELGLELSPDEDSVIAARTRSKSPRKSPR